MLFSSSGQDLYYNNDSIQGLPAPTHHMFTIYNFAPRFCVCGYFHGNKIIEILETGVILYYKLDSSEKHLRDITGILKIYKGKIDFEYLKNWISIFDLIEIWEAIEKRLACNE
jgi:hypothetical protein